MRTFKSYFDYYTSRDSLLNANSNPHKILAIDQVLQLYKPEMFCEPKLMSQDKITFVSKTHHINQRELENIKKLQMNFIPLSHKIRGGLDLPMFLPLFSITEKKKVKQRINEILTDIWKILSLKNNFGVNYFLKSMEIYT